MVQTPAKSLTLEEFLALPETEPVSEFIDGQIIQKPMPKGRHSAIGTELPPAINQTLRTEKIARAFSELRCVFGDRAIVPDIAVFVWERIARDSDGKVANEFYAPPDWMIEILSPDQNQTKLVKKILHGFQHGTQMGWIINPDELSIFVYTPGTTEKFLTDFYDMDAPDEQIDVPVFAKSLTLTVGQIFSWLEE